MQPKQIIRSMGTDRHNNPELVRIVTMVGAAVCMLVFVESNIYYVLSTQIYDLADVGDFMTKFAESFAYIVGAGAAGIATRSYVDRGMPSRKREEVSVDAEH